MKRIHILPILLFFLTFISFGAKAQKEMAAKESKFYKITDVPIPDNVMLEVGGLAFTDDDKLGVSTRRGEIWVISDPYQKSGKQPTYTRFASGLHEPLGLAYRNGAFYATQRGEITKMTDTDRDGKADLFKTIYAWPLSGNYHEYSYGPLFLPNGDMLVTLNLSWIGRGASLTKWRGWMLKVNEQGEMTPFATGLRSPAAFALNADGEVFYAENQGDWIGSGRITHLQEGTFAGHPAGLRWSQEPNSPVNLKLEAFNSDSVGLMYNFAKEHEALKIPAVWFPHTLVGISTSAIHTLDTDAFGPFKGQLLVGDQGHSKIMRVDLEKVQGEYQGAVFPFREGFSSGILRFAKGSDGSLFVGMTSRGWASTGPELFGLQRLSPTGQTPFEIKTMRVRNDGFELEFTKPVNKKVAANPQAYQMTGFTYSYQRKYGSPIIDQKACPVQKVEVSKDGRKVRLYVKGLRAGYVHELKADGVRSAGGEELLHPVGYYSLNAFPDGGGGHAHHTMPVAQQDARTGGPETSGCGTDPAKNVTTPPNDWGASPEIVINMGTKPGLQFSLENFEVPEGSRVRIVFNNDDDMLHNFVITAPGKADDVGNTAMKMGLNGSQVGYIPDMKEVLYYTCLLQPETAQSIYFVAPKAGEYPYICTFPGHHFIMKGTMRVVDKSKASR